jgi:hypothetical protein
MDKVINFLTTNYWILITGAVVLFMAVVGYFAEKTDFGRKQPKPVEPKPAKEKELKIKKEEVIEVPAFEMPVAREEEPMVEESDEVVPLYDETGMEQVEEHHEEEPMLEEEIKEPTPAYEEVEEEPMFEEALAEEPFVEQPVEEPKLEEALAEEPVMEEVEEEPKLEEVVSAEPISFEEKEEVNDINQPLPDLNSLQDADLNDEDENDVWKF